MACIVEQLLDEDGLYIKGSNGREFRITPAEVLAIEGTGSQRAATIKRMAVDALGEDMIDESQMYCSVDSDTGIFTRWEIR